MALAGEGYNSDARTVNNLIRAGYTDDEIADFMVLPRFPYIEHGELVPGRQLWVREDNRIAIVFYIEAADTLAAPPWTCYQSQPLYDYCGANDKENEK